jgi:flavin-dependent thymidylate synthase
MGDVKVITEPSVYLLGKQIVVNEELTRFLADHGVEWSSDSEVPAEVLTETAGRVCYMSFQRPRPGGNSAYLNHIKEVGHGCYDSETDVLTAKGWKAWPDVSLVDQLATIDPLTKRIEYHPPIRLVKYHHTGRMYRVASQCVDLMVTPDHRMLAAMTTTKAGRENPDYQLLTAEEIGTRSHRYLKCGEWDNPFPGFSVDRDVLALLGFAIGDGHIHGPGSTTVRFHLRRERKISWLRALCARLRDRGFRLYENPERDNYAVLLPDEGIALDLFSRIYDEDREKMIPQQVLLHASRDALEGLYEGLMQSDGHEGRTGDSFDTTSPHLPGQFQQLCLHLGFAANVCYTYGPDQRPASYGSKPLTRLSVIRRCLRPEVNKWSGSEGRSFWVDEWEGDVYCAEVPNNTLYVRRNGKPVWSGNSVLEHGVWNLLLTGVSRSLTHELVRHRAGMGYCLAGDVEVFSGSQQKGRFDGVKKKWTMKQLYEWSKDPKRKGRLKLMTVRCFDGESFVQARIKAVSCSGIKRIYRVSLDDGKMIRCSLDHRFMTPEGWKTVRDLQVGECLGTNGLPTTGLVREELYDRYHKQNQTLAQIAQSFNCSLHTVRKWLRRFGLQKAQGVGMLGREAWNKGLSYTAGWHHSEQNKELFRTQKLGEKNSRWLGDNASPNAGRLRAQKLFPKQPCEACGYSEGHRHHLDRNTLNNHRSNIQFLCNSCHQLKHLEEDGSPNLLTVRWVPIVSIKQEGDEPTYDLEVDHDSHNFVANGIITHNSQLSQRYVDESVAEYVEPDIIASDPDLHAIWLECVKNSHAAYVKLAEGLNQKLADPKAAAAAMLPPDADRTTRRKAARQAARSVLPNATETKIFVTANARALRHFLEQRGSQHAEPEIRKLANVILDVLAKDSPNLFGDYERIPLPDGTFEIKTKYPKV